MCSIDNTCEQLCALETIGGSGSGDVTLEVCSCMNGFVLDENMENCTGECVRVCVCVLWVCPLLMDFSYNLMVHMCRLVLLCACCTTN